MLASLHLPLGAANKAEGGVICLFSDITAVVDLEEQLRLKETLARLGELTAGIAHEFRNGLATIHGYGKLLDPSALPVQFQPYVEGIRQETEALGQVVTNFLNFARPTQLSLATHDLGAIIDRVSEDLRPEARQLKGDIVVSGTFGRIDADDVLLRQAFMNLLRNAIEACQEKGVSPDVNVEGAIDGGVIRVTVRDNGPGDRGRGAGEDLPSVLHDQEDRHRSRSRAGAEDHRDPQRPHQRRSGARRRRRVSRDIADFLTSRRSRRWRFCDLSWLAVQPAIGS
jgi:signal transduction histidine kinase